MTRLGLFDELNPTVVLVCLPLLTLPAVAGAVSPAVAAQPGVGVVSIASRGRVVSAPPDGGLDLGTGSTGISRTLSNSKELQEDDENEGNEDGEDGERERESGPSVLPEWWGLGGETTEAAYVGLVELGVTFLVLGVGGYSAGKRLSLVPARHRLRLLQAHEWTVLLGVGLTVPHFLFAGEWEGLGLLVGILLGVEVLSGIYGRHLHRHVVRLGRGEDAPAIVGRFLEASNRVLFRRWRRVHVSLTLLTTLVLVLHVVTAVGD